MDAPGIIFTFSKDKDYSLVYYDLEGTEHNVGPVFLDGDLKYYYEDGSYGIYIFTAEDGCVYTYQIDATTTTITSTSTTSTSTTTITSTSTTSTSTTSTTTITCPPDEIESDIISDNQIVFSGSPAGPFDVTFMDENGDSHDLGEKILDWSFFNAISIYGTYTFMMGSCSYEISVPRPTTSTTSTTSTTTTTCPPNDITYEIGGGVLTFSGSPGGPFYAFLVDNDSEFHEIGSGVTLPYVRNEEPIYGTYTFVTGSCVYVVIVVFDPG